MWRAKQAAGGLTWRPGRALDEAGGKGVAVEGCGEAAVALFAARTRRPVRPLGTHEARLAGGPALAPRAGLALLAAAWALWLVTFVSMSLKSEGCEDSGQHG